MVGGSVEVRRLDAHLLHHVGEVESWRLTPALVAPSIG
jgi:hypothetical protein